MQRLKKSARATDKSAGLPICTAAGRLAEVAAQGCAP